MPNASLELQACLLSGDNMLGRLKRLEQEYDAKVRSVDPSHAARVETLENEAVKKKTPIWRIGVCGESPRIWTAIVSPRLAHKSTLLA